MNIIFEYEFADTNQHTLEELLNNVLSPGWFGFYRVFVQLAQGSGNVSQSGLQTSLNQSTASIRVETNAAINWTPQVIFTASSSTGCKILVCVTGQN